MALHTHTASRRQRGAAIVEFALILSLLLFLLGGIIEFGRAFWYYDALTKATRDGARIFSVQAKATINSAAISKAQNVVVAAATAAGISDLTTSNVTVTCLAVSTYADGSCVDGTAPGGVRVQITGYTFLLGTLFPMIRGDGTMFSRTLTLSPSTTMRYMM